MLAYTLRRIAHGSLSLLGITVVVFALTRAVPGDPIDYYVGRAGTRTVPPEVVSAIRARHHLDDPVVSQYMAWLTAAIRLDFGESHVDRRAVFERIAEKLPNTVVLNIAALFLAIVIAIPIGIFTSLVPRGVIDRGSAMVLLLLYSIPGFWAALMLLDLFSMRLEWLPLLGMTSVNYDLMGVTARIGDRLEHIILPAVTMALGQIALLARFARASMLEVMGREFITTARAKGGGAATVIRHAARNAAVPFVTLFGVAIPMLISGSVIVERIFQWDGVGQLFFESILARDYPTIMAMTLVTAVVTLASYIVTDLLYAVADPRVRLQGGE